MISPEKKQDYAEMEKFLNSCHIMTLGTSDGNSVWTAPVYYIYREFRFYFFSKTASRHILHAEAFGRAAASIHDNPQGWADIKGVQMEGVVAAAGGGEKAVRAFGEYVKRFSFVREIKDLSFSGSLAGFTGQFKVRWYTFIPETIVYLDNSINFGYRRQFQCHQGE